MTKTAAGYDLLTEKLRANEIAWTLPAGAQLPSMPCGFQNNQLLFNVFHLFDNRSDVRKNNVFFRVNA